MTTENIRIKDLVERLFPLHLTLVSDGTDKALEIVGQYLPTQVYYSIETYTPNESVWTWKVPERYIVHEAYLETESGERIVDFRDNSLHLVSYSLPIDEILTWEQLESHLHFSPKRPQAIPWVFKYYERSWGFCLTKELYDRLPRDQKYHAVIKSEFDVSPERGLRVGTGLIKSEQ